MSAWGTVDTYQLTPGGFSEPAAMAGDAAGNVYASGRGLNASGTYDGIVREKVAGSGSWATIEATSAVPNFGAMALDARGDVFVSGEPAIPGNPSTNPTWQVWERPAGQTAFSVIDKLTSSSSCLGLATDAAGNVFATGVVSETVSIRKNTFVSQDHWVVREMAGGAGAFSTIDDFYGGVNSLAHAVGVVPSGPAAGIYVVGGNWTSGGSYGILNWLVRRSTDGGHTWANVDSFYYNSQPLSPDATQPWAVTGDAAGNVYVAGYGDSSLTGTHWIVRKSGTGSAGSWAVNDDFQLGASARAVAKAVGVDTAGNVYVSGLAFDPSGNVSLSHDIVRTNVGGTWTTVDDYQGGSVYGNQGFAVDSGGNLYSAGQAKINNVETWIVRSSPGPGSTAGVSATATAAVFSSVQVVTASDQTEIFHHGKHRR
jgi:hypothetical protein